MTKDPLALVREVALSLPNVEEKLSHGEPAWFHKGKKLFAMFADRHHDDRVAIWMAAVPGIQESLIQESPDRYFRPPYVGVRGWVGAYLDVDFDAAEISALLAEAHACTDKPKR